MRRFLVAAVLSLAVAACSAAAAPTETAAPSPTPTSTTSSEPPAPTAAVSPACDHAFAAAAAVDPMLDSVEDLDPAVRACETLEEWTAASERHPGAIPDGVDPRDYLSNRCLYGEGLASTRLCKSLPSAVMSGSRDDVEAARASWRP